MAAGVLTGELCRHADALNAAEREMERVVAGLDDAAFNWRPAPARWSIAQCVAHLSLTARLYLPALDDAIAAARAIGLTGPGPYRHGWLGTLFVRSLEPPPRLRARVPRRALEPPAELELEDTRAVYLAAHEELRQRLAASSDVNLGRARLRSPFAAGLTLSLGQAFAALTAHERRHLWQAARVRAAPGFPTPG
jgi:hypothetical protein